METTRTVILEYGLDGENIRRLEIHPEEPTSYKIDDPGAPGCLRVFHGRKTIIVPLRNLAKAEFEL